jgi:ribonuclease J
MAGSSPIGIPVRLVALGGLGEIGLNLMAIECSGSAIIIDWGVMFPDQPEFGGGVLIPEFSWLERTRVKIEGIVLTHAHEDHIGALPHLLRRIKVPVYGTDLTLAFVRRRFAEASVAEEVSLVSVWPRRPFRAGPFEVEPIRVTHSTPDSVALAIRTPAGTIVHTGDFKIDEAPVDDRVFDRERFVELGREGVVLLLSDSTNVERAGRSPSESSLKPVLREIMSRSRRRFFLSAFSSHLHRFRQVAEVAAEMGRHVAPLGRRISESVRLGLETGQLPLHPGAFVEAAEAQFLEPRKVAYLTSGSQGEPLSALAKLSKGTHPRVQIEPEDVVVLSSRFIPGNERAINTLVNRLYQLGAEVFYDAVAPVHVSGHASRDELAEMLLLTRPKYFVPIHGEFRHLARHVALAIEAGIAERNCFLLEDGDTLVLNGAQAHRGQNVDAGRVMIDEGGARGDVAVLGERRVLAQEGTVTAILIVSAKTGQIIAGPDLVSRGLVSGDGTSAHMRRARDELAARLRDIGGPYRADAISLKDEVVRIIRGYFSEELGKRPLVVPHVVEV